MRAFAMAFVATVAASSAAALAAPPCRQDVAFSKGASSATYSGRVAGYDYCDYVFTASAGQTLTVAVSGRHSNRLTPVLFDPEQQVDLSEAVTLDRSGRHIVRVLMPRVFARRGNSVSYKVTITIR